MSEMAEGFVADNVNAVGNAATSKLTKKITAKAAKLSKSKYAKKLSSAEKEPTGYVVERNSVSYENGLVEKT